MASSPTTPPLPTLTEDQVEEAFNAALMYHIKGWQDGTWNVKSDFAAALCQLALKSFAQSEIGPTKTSCSEIPNNSFDGAHDKPSEPDLLPGLREALLWKPNTPQLENAMSYAWEQALRSRVRAIEEAYPGASVPSSATAAGWQDCVRCGAAILNEHPAAADRGSSRG